MTLLLPDDELMASVRGLKHKTSKSPKDAQIAIDFIRKYEGPEWLAEDEHGYIRFDGFSPWLFDHLPRRWAKRAEAMFHAIADHAESPSEATQHALECEILKFLELDVVNQDGYKPMKKGDVAKLFGIKGPQAWRDLHQVLEIVESDAVSSMPKPKAERFIRVRAKNKHAKTVYVNEADLARELA